MSESRPVAKPTDLTMSLAVKLGSLVVHADELDPDGDGWEFDLAAMRALLGDAEVIGWLGDAEVIGWLSSFAPGLLPEKRS